MMDLMPLHAGVGRSSFAGQQTTSTDFSDELKKAPERQPSSERQPAMEKHGESAGQPPPASAGQGEQAGDSPPDPLCAKAIPVSELASIERVLSARVFGMHLEASAYLSQYMLAEEQGNHPVVHGDDMKGRHAFTVQAQSEVVAPTQAVPSVVACGNAGQEVLAVSGLAHGDVEHVEDASASSLPLVGWSSWAEALWQGRSVRLATSPDGKRGAWLRDYTVSEGDARKLAIDLVQMLKKQGVHLQSVMWNGHEIWSSKNTDQGI